MHELTLHYYNTDDGIWLVCDKWNSGCGWGKNLGFGATPQDVQDAVAEHDREVEVDQ